jgi:hypothetical protein
MGFAHTASARQDEGMPSSPWPSSGLLDLAPVLPVVVIEDVADAVPLARALVAGGCRRSR